VKQQGEGLRPQRLQPPPPSPEPRAGSKECAVCHRWFRDQYRLTVHQRTHSGEKPFECGQCHKAFADPSNLRHHAKRHHADHTETTDTEDVHSCDVCDAVVATNGDLQRHFVDVHGGIVLEI